MFKNLSENRTMFYGASASVFAKAEMLRHNMTEAEQVLWKELSDSKFKGFRFKPQHPVYAFIADFYCHKAKLIIEVDGGIHNLIENKEYDINREYVIKELGIDVIRFTNEEVLKNIKDVLPKIEIKLKQRLTELETKQK